MSLTHQNPLNGPRCTFNLPLFGDWWQHTCEKQEINHLRMEFVMQSPLNMCICFECNKTLTKVNNCTYLEINFTILKWGAYCWRSLTTHFKRHLEPKIMRIKSHTCWVIQKEPIPRLLLEILLYWNLGRNAGKTGSKRQDTNPTIRASHQLLRSCGPTRVASSTLERRTSRPMLCRPSPSCGRLPCGD